MNKKELLALRKTWYKKLKETGFHDIEHISDGRFLDDHVFDAMQRGFRNLRNNYSGYYDAIHQFIEHTTASNRRSRIHAMLMSRGLSQREIARITARMGSTKYGVHLELVRMMRRAQSWYKEVYIPQQIAESNADDQEYEDQARTRAEGAAERGAGSTGTEG